MQVAGFKAVDGPNIDGERQRVVKAAAGLSFSVLLTEDGKGATRFSLSHTHPSLIDDHTHKFSLSEVVKKGSWETVGPANTSPQATRPLSISFISPVPSSSFLYVVVCH